VDQRRASLRGGDGDQFTAGLEYPRPFPEGGEGAGQAIDQEGVDEYVEGGVGEGKLLAFSQGEVEVGQLVTG